MKGKVFAAFPGLGKSTLCTKYYDNDTTIRTKFLDLDYHFFKRFLGFKLVSSRRSNAMYRAAVSSIKKIEPRTVILVNHLTGLEGLVDGVIVPGFDLSCMRERFLNRSRTGKLEPGEEEILKNYDEFIKSWTLWANRNHVEIETLKLEDFISDSILLRPFIQEFEHYEFHKRR